MTITAYTTPLGTLATSPTPISDLVVGDRLVVHAYATPAVYEVTGACGDDPGGHLSVRDLTSSDADVRRDAEPDVDDPRAGVFVYSPNVMLNKVVGAAR
ncbi:hypothetical protein F0L68_40450 [Solihabitans fulvus]|uniref:Uncharacterized protein n=1 Tax=Solihabitans fulvus TaxID=1892852 RepID=A0A5B2W874_9PSEU|nr:hypothetical protein [Solihabitans fulvus]KAA2247018.1 hypothetical protein F0L68_40450 [Solihabitans fulvus]